MPFEMEHNRIHILSTRPLSESLIKEVQEQRIYIDESPFIRTEPIQSIEVQQEIEQAFLLTVPVVFTSMNAVDAVAYYIEETQPEWQIYCIGTTTNKLAAKYFGEASIAGTANDAESLAELIVEDSATDEVIFFCGDQRRDASERHRHAGEPIVRAPAPLAGYAVGSAPPRPSRPLSQVHRSWSRASKPRSVGR